MWRTVFVVILFARIGQGHPRAETSPNGSIKKRGSHYGASADFVTKGSRCEPCEQSSRSFPDEIPISNSLNPEYRGNGADNLGYDWTPMAWGGLAHPQKSKSSGDDRMRERGGRHMSGRTWDQGLQENVRIVCDTCRAYWTASAQGGQFRGSSGGHFPASGGSSGGHFPASGGSSGGHFASSGGHFPASGGSSGGHFPASGGSSGGHFPSSGDSSGGQFPASGGSSGGHFPISNGQNFIGNRPDGLWYGGGSIGRGPQDYETRVSSGPIGILVKPGSRIAYIPSRSGDMIWDGVSGGGTRWDGFSNGISWLVSSVPEWGSAKWQSPGGSQRSGKNFFRGPSNGNDPTWDGNSYYYPNGYPSRVDSRWRDRAYASNWQYGSTNENGWNGGNVKWSYGSKNWDDNDRSANKFYFDSPQEKNYVGGRYPQYGNRYPDYERWSGQRVRYGTRLNDRDPSPDFASGFAGTRPAYRPQWRPEPIHPSNHNGNGDSGYGPSYTGGGYPFGGNRFPGSAGDERPNFYPDDSGRPSHPGSGHLDGAGHQSGGSYPTLGHDAAIYSGGRPSGGGGGGGSPSGYSPSGGYQPGPAGGNRHPGGYLGSSGGGYSVGGGRPGGYSGSSGGGYPEGGGRPGGYSGSSGYLEGSGRPEGSHPSKGSVAGGYSRPGGGGGGPYGGHAPFPGGNVGSGYYPGGGSGYTGGYSGRYPEGYSSARPSYSSSGYFGYPVYGSGGSHPSRGGSSPKGYYTGIITEIPNDRGSYGGGSYGGDKINYPGGHKETYPYGGKYPGYADGYSGGPRDGYSYGGNHPGDKSGYYGGHPGRYPDAAGNTYQYGGDNSNGYSHGAGGGPNYGGGKDKGGDRFYYHGQDGNKDRRPDGFPGGGSSGDQSQGSTQDKNAWNYDDYKDGTLHRSGGSYPPYRGGQYFTSSYLATATTASQQTSESKTQSVTESDQVTRSTPAS